MRFKSNFTIKFHQNQTPNNQYGQAPDPDPTCSFCPSETPLSALTFAKTNCAGLVWNRNSRSFSGQSRYLETQRLISHKYSTFVRKLNWNSSIISVQSHITFKNLEKTLNESNSTPSTLQWMWSCQFTKRFVHKYPCSFSARFQAVS